MAQITITATDSSGTSVLVQESGNVAVTPFISPTSFTTNQISCVDFLSPDGTTEISISDTGTTFTALTTHSAGATVNGNFIVNNNFAEIVSTDAGATEMPIFALTRNSASPAANDKLGAIRWFGEADSGEKKFFGEIYTKAADIGDASEQGQLVFTVAADNGLQGAASPNAVTDVTADLTNDLDPAMTLDQNGLSIPGTNYFIIDGVDGGGINFKNTSGHNGTLTASHSAERNWAFPNVSGTIITEGNLSSITSVGTLDKLEVASTADTATPGPVIGLYRNSASPATSDRLGSLRFFGENASGEKVFYGGIDGKIGSSVADGSHTGAMEFTLADGSSSGSAITDITADVTTDEDPVMTLHKYGLVMGLNNDIFLSQATDNITWDTGSHQQFLQGRSAESSGGNSTITLPDATQGVLEIGALGSGAVVTGTSIAHATFSTYKGQKIVFTGSSACTIGLPDAAAGDIGATWTVCNAGSANVIFDLDASAAQTLKILTGAAVTDVGTDNPHIVPGGVASLVCTAADNFILFGSGVVNN